MEDAVGLVGVVVVELAFTFFGLPEASIARGCKETEEAPGCSSAKKKKKSVAGRQSI